MRLEFDFLFRFGIKTAEEILRRQIGDQIWRRRQELGFSQKKLAVSVKVSPHRIARLEKGEERSNLV